MAYVVDPNNIANMVLVSDHVNKPLTNLLIQDLKTFLLENYACDCKMVKFNFDN